jgi:hypothetical protein
VIPLPNTRGPLTEALFETLTGGRRHPICRSYPPDARGDDDLQLALFIAYELHYGGVVGVDEDLEWSPEILRFRRTLETRFETSVRAAVDDAPPAPSTTIDRELRAIVRAHGDGALTAFLAEEATEEQFREFLEHRSVYHLKEADPFTWAIPRLEGAAKAAMVQIQTDEYGGGDPAWMHSRLFADTMAAVGLDPSCGPPIDRLPGTTLATVNLITTFGLNRRLRGALVGHLAAFEMTSCIPNRRYGDGLRRLGFDATATRFFDEHVEADAVHEAIAANDLAGSLASQEPALAGDILFGAKAMLVTEARASEALLSSWRSRPSARAGGRTAPAVLAR